MVKVFFNNSCNICRTEINHYKKHCDDSIEWIDVTDNQEAQQITLKPLFFLLNIFYEIAAFFLFLKNKHLLKK